MRHPARTDATAVRALALLASVCLLLTLGLVRCAPQARPAPEPEPMFRAELRSWIVAGRGRHMYLLIEPPPGVPGRPRRIEFTTLLMRDDYRFSRDASGAPRVGMMRGGIVAPPAFAGPPDNRLEAVYELTRRQVECLLRDRVFETPYVLLTTNSNAAMRRACEECGVTLPPRVRDGKGLLGEFPGIEYDVGAELPTDQRPSFGLTP